MKCLLFFRGLKYAIKAVFFGILSLWNTMGFAFDPQVFKKSINYLLVCRISPATPGLFNSIAQYSNAMSCWCRSTVVSPNPIDQIWTDFEEKKFRRKALFFGKSYHKNKNCSDTQIT